MLRFSDYRFDPEQLILYKEDSPVTLTANQAKILGLLLSNPEQIFSKDDILKAVWGERIVSEQVVFQNISQLRGIFSEGAIKTFPKRGYQWQLAFEIQNENIEEPTSEHLPAKQSVAKRKWITIGILMLAVLSLLFWFKGVRTPSHQNTNKTAQHADGASIHFIPFSTRFNDQIASQLAEHNQSLAEAFP